MSSCIIGVNLILWYIVYPGEVLSTLCSWGRVVRLYGCALAACTLHGLPYVDLSDIVPGRVRCQAHLASDPHQCSRCRGRSRPV